MILGMRSGLSTYQPSLTYNFMTSTALPYWLTSSRASNATMFDASGALTYAPNNQLLNSATLSTQNVTTSAINYILSFYGTGSVTLSGTASATVNGTGASNQVYLAFTPTAGTLALTVSGSVTSAVLAQVTHETTPRPGDQVITTSAAYYGPRFDYTGGSADGWLNEAAATNLSLYSNDFSQTAVWVTQASNLTPNATTSPDGTTNATHLADTVTNNTHEMYQIFAGPGGITKETYFVKAGASGRYLNISYIAYDGTVYRRYYTLYDLVTGTYLSTQDFTLNSPQNTSNSIVSIGNGWYQITVSMLTYSAQSTYIACALSNSATPSRTAVGDIIYVGTGLDVYIFGFGASVVGGSYIPTTTAAVTRAADVPGSNAPLTALLAANPSIWELQDEATGVISRVVYAAGTFTFPTGKWYRSMAVAPVIPSRWLTVGAPYQ